MELRKWCFLSHPGTFQSNPSKKLRGALVDSGHFYFSNLLLRCLSTPWIFYVWNLFRYHNVPVCVALNVWMSVFSQVKPVDRSRLIDKSLKFLASYFWFQDTTVYALPWFVKIKIIFFLLIPIKVLSDCYYLLIIWCSGCILIAYPRGAKFAIQGQILFTNELKKSHFTVTVTVVTHRSLRRKIHCNDNTNILSQCLPAKITLTSYKLIIHTYAKCNHKI